MPTKLIFFQRQKKQYYSKFSNIIPRSISTLQYEYLILRRFANNWLAIIKMQGCMTNTIVDRIPETISRFEQWRLVASGLVLSVTRDARSSLGLQIQGYRFPISIRIANRYRPRKYSWIGTDHQIRVLYTCACIYLYIYIYPRYINHKATWYRRYINPNYVRALMFAFDNEFGFANARCLCTRMPCISADPTDRVKVRNRVKQTCVRICVRIDHESDSKERSSSRLIIDMHNWYVNFGKYWFIECEDTEYYIPFRISN